MTKRILVRCPTTSKLVATGQLVDDEFWDDTKLEPFDATCRYCAGTHAWSKHDVVLAR